MFLCEQKVSRNSQTVSLLMHESVSALLYQGKKLPFFSSGTLTHFCLSDFCFLSVCMEDKGKKRKTFLFSQFLNLISFHLHLLGTGTGIDKRLMMRKHVQHKPQEPLTPNIIRDFYRLYSPLSAHLSPNGLWVSNKQSTQ